MLKHQLFRHNSHSRRGRAAAAGAGADNLVRAFGKDVPNVIPESTAWSKEQARDLDAITDVTELGCACLRFACSLSALVFVFYYFSSFLRCLSRYLGFFISP